MLLHDAKQPFYTYRTRAADLQRPFQTASATFSNGRWKRTTALKIPRESWTKRELERRTRYHYLAVVYPRLVSRSKVTLLRSSAREANSRSSDCRFRNGMWETVFYLVQNPTRGSRGDDSWRFSISRHVSGKSTFRFFSTSSRLHLPYLSKFESRIFNISTESDIFADIKGT